MLHSLPSGKGPPQAQSQTASTEPQWLTLTDLGRIYGISAVHCGRLLADAGLRDSHGEPTRHALRSGCAIRGHRPHAHGPTQWHRDQCQWVFEKAGLKPIQRTTLVQQWAELLSALIEGSPSISISAEQMAEEVPGDLVDPVNAELRDIGCSFQVKGHRASPLKHQSKRRREERGNILLP